MTFGEFKSLCYPDAMPMESCLVDVLMKKQISYQEINMAYTNALDYERHVANSKFNEAATCILQNLSGNFTKDEDKDKLNKRSIHILNECGIFPKHIYDCMYNYTKEDEKEYDEFCNNMYGKIFFHENEKPINEG